jgi:Rad3-related DNA helicase
VTDAAEARRGQEDARAIGVRALCEFAARSGDLDLRFQPSPTAQEGIAGHGTVAHRRPASYAAELLLTGSHRGVVVRGRADGYDRNANRLEEIKTHRGDLARQPASQRQLHWAQAKVYGALLCETLGLADIELALVYFDVGSQQETVIAQRHDATNLRAFLELQCERFLDWSRQEAAHAEARRDALEALRFPHSEFRTGQRALAEAVWRAGAHGRCLVAQAPTGIGKTMGTLFPLLKAWPGRDLDKVYFLTAKGSGRGLALDALRRVRTAATPLRVVELVAREKACEHPDEACHPESCPLARGHYDRLPAARAAAVAEAFLDQAVLRDLGRTHGVCPYHLGHEVVRWADVVVADYNHYFDVHALLHGLALAHEWRVALLVDEAHNLLERARRMYSAELDRARLRAARRAAPAVVARALDRLGRQWTKVHAGQTADHRVHDEVPADLVAALQRATSAIGDHLAEAADTVAPDLLDFHFEALHFLRLAERFGPHAIFDVSLGPPGRGKRRDATFGLRNLVPAPHLKPRFAAARACVLFSATLTPLDFHRDTLGLPEDTAWLDVASPFDSGQLAVHVAAGVSTRWADREASLDTVVALIGQQYARAPGNYLAFFSSFDYLQRAAARFAARHPDVPAWSQARGMEPAARDAFLARFTEDGRGVGFAVLGGSFAEGVDLPGRRCIGAFVATLGLPPVSPLNEQIRRRMQESFGAGWDYAYLYPGIQKVVQAAGRVVRAVEDRGVVHLIDDRYRRPEVRALLPSWWRMGGESAGTPPRPTSPR